MVDPDKVMKDLAEFLPEKSKLADYVILVEGYRAEHETEQLAAKRAQVIAELLCENFDIDPAMIREKTGKDNFAGASAQRTDVSFLYVGRK